MTERYGRCINFEGGCPRAAFGEKIPVPLGAADVVCPEPGCGKLLAVVEPTGGDPRTKWTFLAAIAIAASIAALFIARFLAGGRHDALPALPVPSAAATNGSFTTARPTPQRTKAPLPRPPSSPPALPALLLPTNTPPAAARTPRPTLPPSPHPSYTPKPYVPARVSVAGPGPANPVATETPAIAPAAAPTESCDTPNAPAHLVSRVEAGYPKSEIGSGQKPTVDIKIDVDDHGEITHAKIVQSTGSKVFEDAALDAAMRSSFAAPIVNCVPRSGAYMLHVDFYIDK
jgi:TonB family protein